MSLKRLRRFERRIRPGFPAWLAAFTRLELAAVLAALALLALVALPLLAVPANRADRVMCANNLRLLGRAFNIWGSEHGDRFPWMLLYDANDPTNIGTQGHVCHEQLWFQFACLSNEMQTPRILSCPADQRRGKRTATTWDSDPQHGLLCSGFQNNAISYQLNLHLEPIVPYPMLLLLAWDRNISNNGRSGCSFRFSNAGLFYPPFTGLKWKNDVHGTVGNMVYLDGHVDQGGDSTFRNSFIAQPSSVHFLLPF